MSVYSAIQFLMWLLIAASVIAVVAARIRVPYTVALVLGGLALGSFHLPFVDVLLNNRTNWVTPDITLGIFLPPLLFEGSLKLNLRELRENALPISLLATVGVLLATLVAGFAAHWALGLPLLVALAFGAITAATDPISVLSIFKEMTVPKKLSVIVEGESLFNDGVAAVLYGILVAGITSGNLGIGEGVRHFVVEVAGGVVVGLLLGYLSSKVLETIDDPQVEITLTTVLAYGSYLLAQSLQLSGVIATVSAGLMLGNLGAKVGMSARTRVALWGFWGYFSFIINSLVFLLIGLQVHFGALIASWRVNLLAIGAVFLGRMLSVYGLIPVSNMFRAGVPLRWQHVLVAGGIRGALSLALALSLGSNFPHREQILATTFAVVAFTIVSQGLAIRPLLAFFGMSCPAEGDYERARVQQMSIFAAQSELEGLLRNQTLTQPAFEQLRVELNARLEQINTKLTQLYGEDESRIVSEVRIARKKLINAEKSSIEEAQLDGLISPRTADKMIEESDRQLDLLSNQG
jgi:monovalent cation:H+ antiporter, CPA1 family